MNAFLDSMRTSASSFRAEALRAGRELRQIESEFRDLRQRTDSLLRAIDMPPRDDSGTRDVRVNDAAAQRRKSLVVRSQIHPDGPIRVARADTPVTVLPFRTEMVTAFRARSRVVAHSARIRPEPIRFVPIEATA
jgi:hypothetical protein